MQYLIILLVVFSSNIFANTTDISVELNIGNKNDNFVREEARVMALIAASDDLPSLVSGVQQLNDGIYSENIKALGFANFHSELKTEVWDRVNGLYKATFSISLDVEKTMGLLNDASRNENAKASLLKAVDQIKQIAKDGITRSELIELKSISKRIVSGDYYKGMLTVDKLLRELNNELYIDSLNQLVEEFVSSAKVELVRNDTKKGLTQFNIKGNANWNEFKTITQKMENMLEVSKAKDVCLINDLGVFYVYDIASQKNILQKGLTGFDGKPAHFSNIPVIIYHSNNEDFLERFVNSIRVIECYKPWH
jgi:hypothetical protein